MRTHCIMHVPSEGPGYLKEWLDGKNESLTIWPLYQNPVLPDPGIVDFLIVMGGPMNIYDSENYPWLDAEKSFLRLCIEQGKKILGICLGAQLLADVLGTDIYPCNSKEIGWFPLTIEKEVCSNFIFRQLPETFTAFHWHGETFNITEGARRIGSSEACINQGFILNEQVLAFQFHLEITPDLVKQLIRHGRNELDNSPFVQEESLLIKGLSNRHNNRKILFSMLDVFFVDILTDTSDNE